MGQLVHKTRFVWLVLGTTVIDFFNSWNHLYTWHKFGIDLGYLLRSKSLCFDMFPVETFPSKLDSISSRIQAICKKERISFLSKRDSAIKILLSLQTLQTEGSHDTHWYCCLVSKFQQHYFKLSNNFEPDYFRFLNTHCSWQSSWEKLRRFVLFKGLVIFFQQSYTTSSRKTVEKYFFKDDENLQTY